MGSAQARKSKVTAGEGIGMQPMMFFDAGKFSQTQAMKNTMLKKAEEEKALRIEAYNKEVQAFKQVEEEKNYTA